MLVGTVLAAAGQERHQDFDGAVRSKIAALAERTAAPETRGAGRVRSLREYRREAMQLVLDCSREVPGL